MDILTVTKIILVVLPVACLLAVIIAVIMGAVIKVYHRLFKLCPECQTNTMKVFDHKRGAGLGIEWLCTNCEKVFYYAPDGQAVERKNLSPEEKNKRKLKLQ